MIVGKVVGSIVSTRKSEKLIGNCCLSGHNTENEKNKFRLAIMEDTVIMIL